MFSKIVCHRSVRKRLCVGKGVKLCQLYIYKYYSEPEKSTSEGATVKGSGEIVELQPLWFPGYINFPPNITGYVTRR